MEEEYQDQEVVRAFKRPMRQIRLAKRQLRDQPKPWGKKERLIVLLFFLLPLLIVFLLKLSSFKGNLRFSLPKLPTRLIDDSPIILEEI